MEIDEEYDYVIVYSKNWENNITTYNLLNELFGKLLNNSKKKFLLNFSEVTFISANILAILGAILEYTLIKKRHKVAFANIRPNVKKIMQKNGFHKYFKWEVVEDTYHTTIEYRVFKANTNKLVEFEKYILLNIFNRDELPIMSSSVQDRIVDNFLEIFNNVIDHAESKYVYVCGQYFYSKKKLVFTIVDIGKTIEENVNEYLGDESKKISNTIEWAIKLGNSTKAQSAPGGLGFGMILDFLRKNKGSFIIVSGNESYELNNSKERFGKLDNIFYGTIVTISFNLDDDFSYILIDDDIIEL
ncbi:Anti-anti-sigma regulatory factor (antagonist of anti-sigma factor) [Anaerosporobacter mobilis DSM 15930]|jgi:anti-anti-sigma regulatory factor|uniref:Anti-anti-sigma regulatory factor (Antagonist of anti-sigma factor) n=1 Tax=Anaerosporobacter mobilis DSM 15930 TaxID=1120996 RepID=A0A1M7MW82_9FIRM|nr:STAS domain-containing protein [Anaerosporobacter mobilis]SHM95327.1 Anti-anti-sigma regulatory factor (antagonist of anti-sigma factor) [Anaerosporobacter mobilis DSM 15930]